MNPRTLFILLFFAVGYFDIYPGGFFVQICEDYWHENTGEVLETLIDKKGNVWTKFINLNFDLPAIYLFETDEVLNLNDLEHFP